MPDYHPYYEGAGPDLLEKHTVESNGIRDWVKEHRFFKFLETWQKSDFWGFTPETRIINYRNECGRGWVELDRLDGIQSKRTFYSYEDVDSLLAEIKGAGVRIDPEFPETWAKNNNP